MTKTNMEIVIDKNSTDVELTLTLRGKPEIVMAALVNGLPREALLDFSAQLDAAMASPVSPEA